jgi:uncharacterized protein involved in outer membrane biogenesis
MLWIRSGWILMSAGVLAALLFAVPFLLPLDRFIPELTRISAGKLGQPVAIAGLRLHPLPTPRAVASGIRIGKRDEVTIGELEIVPELLSLLSGPKTIRLVRAKDVQVKEAALGFAARMPKGGAGEPLQLRRIKLEQVTLLHSSLKLPEFDLEATLADGFALEQARFRTRDGALQVTLEPRGNGESAVLVEARQWTMPAGPPVRFDSLAAQGTLKGEQLNLAKIEARLYGGTVSGTMRADWARQWQVSGKSVAAGVDVEAVQRLLGKKPQITGRLRSEATFSARARSPDQLVNALVLDGPFEVLGGAYPGYDLSKISLGKLTPGGSTKFDELKGKVQVRGQEIKVTGLCVRSPALVAGGNVTIAPDEKLSGRLDVSMAKTGGFVGMPVALGGTAADPSFMPTKGYLIGAAVGTVLLPGIGTSIGASVGGRTEGTSDCK